MPRTGSRQRIEETLDVATGMFMTRGYRRTRMADIAAGVGVTEAALYRYVESKDALFDLVVRRAATADDSVPTPDDLPVPTPEPGATLRFLHDVLEEGSRIPALESALAAEGPPAETTATELEAILRELFGVTARHRIGLKIVERSAADWPDLAEFWFGRVRARLLESLGRYLARRRDAGELWAMPDARASARLILETVAFFAMHRHDDPFPPILDDRAAAETAVRTLLKAHLPPPARTGIPAGERP